MSKEKMRPILDLDSLPVEKTEKATRFSLDKGIDNLVGALCDPIIVYPGGWATKDFIPEWLRTRITLDRMLELMIAQKEGREPIGTDSEALAYMMLASMEFPLNHDWAQIYLYLATIVMSKEANKVVPDDIRVDKLDSDQERDLMRLKVWLYRTKLKHRETKLRDVRREEKEEKKKAAPKVIQHAFKLE